LEEFELELEGFGAIFWGLFIKMEGTAVTEYLTRLALDYTVIKFVLFFIFLKIQKGFVVIEHTALVPDEFLLYIYILLLYFVFMLSSCYFMAFTVETLRFRP